jgi:patatin-like phospholipase/acyl hydrolase
MFRILSLDGGGIKGVYAASALATLEQVTEKRCIDHFDLIAGTSTGGILALGIALGFSAERLLDFYLSRGQYIFPHTSLASGIRSTLRWCVAPKYPQEALRQELTNILGDYRLADAKTRLAIPSYDAIGGRIYVFKTRHNKSFAKDERALAVDVALATSAAPTYFGAAPFPLHKGASYVDGGVWANSPIMVAVVEALTFLQQTPNNIDILSVGTTAAPFNIANRQRSGLLGWNKGLLDLAFAAQSESALAQASLMVSGRVLRINTLTMPGQYTLDNAHPTKLSELASLARAEASKAKTVAQVRLRFLNGIQASPFFATD